MGFGGFAVGFSEQNEVNAKRRLDMSEAFQRYKQENPYATAEDYNQWIESQTGGANFWLRGALPEKHAIERMARENQARKSQEDLNKRIANQASQLQLGQRLNDMVDTMIKSGVDVNKVYPELFRNLGIENDPEQQRMVQSQGGDLWHRKRRIIEKESQDKLSRALRLIGEKQALIPNYEPTEEDLASIFDESQLPEVRKKVQEGIAQEQEARNLKVATARANLRKGIASDPTLINMITMGAYDDDPQKLKDHIAYQLRELGLEPTEQQKEVDTIYESLIAGSEALKTKSRLKKREVLAERLSTEDKEIRRQQDAQYKAVSSLVESEEAAAGLKLLFSRYRLPPQHIDYLQNTIIPEINEKMPDATPGEAMARMVEMFEDVGGIDPWTDRARAIKEQASRALPDPMTENDFNTKAKENVDLIVKRSTDVLEKLEDEAVAALNGSESHRRDIAGRRVNVIDRTIRALQEQADAIASTVDNPEEHLRPWSRDAGQQAVDQITSEIDRLNGMRQGVMLDLESGNAPAEPEAPAEPGPPKRPATRRGRREAGPPPSEPYEPRAPTRRGRRETQWQPKTSDARAIQQGIELAAQKYGLPPEAKALMYAMADIESSWGKNTYNQQSGAAGPFQFIPSTSKQYGLTDPYDPIASADATARHLVDAYNRQGNWFDAAVGHHSGGAWKNLGEHGLDYARKLHDRYRQYLPS